MIVKDLKKNQDSVMDIYLNAVGDGRYCVKVIVYRVAMNLDELLKFTEIAKEHRVEFQISVWGDYFRFEYY